MYPHLHFNTRSKHDCNSRYEMAITSDAIPDRLTGDLVVLTLRTYALWNCNRIILWSLMSISIVSMLDGQNKQF